MLIALTALLLSPADRTVVLDKGGVLRWEDDGTEVALFGVNYYSPFCIDYSKLKAIGADIREVTERDIAQFSRLGFDLIRIHCFDREFSRPDGGLVENEHLALLDHLIAAARARGIYLILTPIAWWPTHETIGGFSDLFTMHEMTTKPEAWSAQARFLAEFVEHLNPETGLMYKDDPCIVAFELINEPITPPGTSDEAVTAYINALSNGIRRTGCGKPLFFNGWGGRHEAVVASEVTGASFGWYPTGLQSGASITDDCLAAVDVYSPALDPVLDGRPKMVYEFDCADVASGVLYPAMARAFRGAGIQMAAQFQYDPTPLATHNSNWPTHYVNLIYAPTRTLALAIAGEAFRRLPRGASFGRYPESNRFGDFRVSHEEGLAEMVTAEAFLYSATTATEPPSPETLERVAGCGSSPVARYEGTGTYFADRIGEGVWRLEVYPDAVWVADPFTPGPAGREVARTYARRREMRLQLPDLGSDFAYESISGPAVSGRARDGAFAVTPGVWVLTRPGAASRGEVESSFTVPADATGPPVAWVRLPSVLPEGEPWRLTLSIAAPEDAQEVAVEVAPGGVPVQASRLGPYEFAAELPGDPIEPPEVEVTVLATVGGRRLRFPGGVPADAPAKPVQAEQLFALVQGDAAPPASQGTDPPQSARSAFVAGSAPGTVALQVSAAALRPGAEWFGARVSAKHVASRELHGNELVVRCRRDQAATRAFELALVMDDGTGYGTVLPLPVDWADVRVPLSSLQLLWKPEGPPLDLGRVREINLGAGSYTFGPAWDVPHGFSVESVTVVQHTPSWRAKCLPRGAPIVLFGPDIRPAYELTGDAPSRRTMDCAGSVERVPALRMEVPGFPNGSCASAVIRVRSLLVSLSAALRNATTLCINARSGEEATSALEVVLKERDGTAWGRNVPLTPQWRVVRVPLADLTHFAHWQSTPAGRGGPGDRLQADAISTVHLTFGAWLFPEQAEVGHAVEVESIWLEP